MAQQSERRGWDNQGFPLCFEHAVGDLDPVRELAYRPAAVALAADTASLAPYVTLARDALTAISQWRNAAYLAVPAEEDGATLSGRLLPVARGRRVPQWRRGIDLISLHRFDNLAQRSLCTAPPIVLG